MENKKKVYPSQQLVCSLDARVLKVFMWLCGWQSQIDIKLYVNQMSKFLHLSEEEVELAIQTLENIKLISIKKVDQTYIANINAEQVNKYFKIPMSKLAESNGIQMATEVTWNLEKTEHLKKELTTEQMKKMIQMLQIRLQEKEEVEKLVMTNNAEKEEDDGYDSLPF